MYIPLVNTRLIMILLKILSFGGLGFLLSIPFSASSKAKSTSWSPLVTRFNHKSCTGRSGIGSPKRKVEMIKSTSANPVEISR